MEFRLSLRQIGLGVALATIGLFNTAAIAQPSAKAEGNPSLYDLKSKWRDINDKPASVSVARGEYAVVAMVYTSCPHACPMTINKLQQIEESLSKGGISNVKFILASFDVKKDRPEHLKKYQRSRSLDPKKWIFLSPESDGDVRELAVALGISYKDLGNGDFSHSNLITLLDQEGAVIATLDNLNAAPEPFLEAIKGAKEKGEALKKVAP